MDLPLLPTPASEHNKQRTGARFTVRSANSPSYSLTRRPGVRKPRGFSEEERESSKEAGARESYRTDTGTNWTYKEGDHTVSGYQAKTGSCSSVKGQCEENETSSHKMSTKLNQNAAEDKTITEFGIDRSETLASECRGRTEWRGNNLSIRSKSLDWRTGEKSPNRGKRADMLVLSTKNRGDISKPTGGLDERTTRVEGARGRVMSSIQAYNSVGTGNTVQECSPVSHINQTLDRASRGHSLPSRLRFQPGPGFGVREATTSSGPKGGQSILERIEKLYGSSGLCKTEDCSKSRDFNTPVMSHHKRTTTDFQISPQQRSYERSTGGTFPRRFSSGENSRLSPVQSRKSFTWTQKDTSGSETSVSPGTSRTRERLSGGQWQGQSPGSYSEGGGVSWGRGLEEIGTRSLDRVRSRYTAAAQIRSARTAGGITEPPQSNTSLEVGRSVSLRDSSGLRERRASGSKDQGRVNHAKEKGETNGINGTSRVRTWGLKEQEEEADDGPKEKNELKSNIDEDVFESNPQKITTKTIERKKCPEVLSASVRNKINQFEALTQRTQDLATGQVLMSRRAFSVPAQLSRDHDGVKKSGSAKAIGGLKDMWGELKEGGKAGDKKEEKERAGKKLGSERSLSVDEVGLRLGRKEREEKDLVENEGKETDIGKSCAEDFGKYSRLKSTLEIPLNGGAQRQQRKFYIDETDFSKVSSPEEARERPPSSLQFNFSDATCPRVSSPVSDEDETPTNTPNHSPFISPTPQPKNASPIADRANESTSVLTRAAETPEQGSPPLPRPLATSSHSNLPSIISPDVKAAYPDGKKQVFHLDAWVAGLNSKVWNDNEDDYEDDDESTQKDEDSNYDSDSGESSVTITSNMSQSDRRSFSVRWVLFISSYFWFDGGIPANNWSVFHPQNSCLSSL